MLRKGLKGHFGLLFVCVYVLISFDLFRQATCRHSRLISVMHLWFIKCDVFVYYYGIALEIYL